MPQPHFVVRRATWLLLLPAIALSTAGTRLAFAQAEAEAVAEAAPPDPAWPYTAPPETNAVPPHVEEAPVAAASGGYCFIGPHPADPRFAPGVSWDDSQGAHVHEYAPIDLRLFAFSNGCYQFIGDPVDFGYQGQTYAYYGAHPVLGAYGGGWCFMIGGHHHFWRPWSPYFVVAGPWYYWQGQYDAVFWSYWPYYASYYRRQYPVYYRGGRFARGGWADRGRAGYAVAPPIGRVAQPVGRVAGQVGRFGAPAVIAGPSDGRTHFGAVAPGPMAPTPTPPTSAWRQPHFVSPTPHAQFVQPIPTPSHNLTAPTVNPWSGGHASFGHMGGGGGGNFRPVAPVQSAGSAVRSFHGGGGGHRR